MYRQWCYINMCASICHRPAEVLDGGRINFGRPPLENSAILGCMTLDGGVNQPIALNNSEILKKKKLIIPLSDERLISHVLPSFPDRYERTEIQMINKHCKDDYQVRVESNYLTTF